VTFSSSADGVTVRPRWMLPNAASLTLLGVDSNVPTLLGSVAMVGEVIDVVADLALVLVEIDDLDASELRALMRGTPSFITARATILPAALDPVLGCIAPSLARARSLVQDIRNQPGGTIECARIEAQRLHPERTFLLNDHTSDVSLDATSPYAYPGPALGDVELMEAIALLVTHPALYRPVLEMAFGHDEANRLRAWLHEVSGQRPGELFGYAGRVVLRVASTAATAGPTQPVPREIVEAHARTPRRGTPAARALEKVAAVLPYRRGRTARGGGVEGKLSANESPFGPPPAVRAAILRAAEDLNRYPEEGPVLDQLAAHLGIDAERLVFTNGSDELCYLLARLTLDDAPSTSSSRRQGFAVLGDPCYQIDATASTLAGAPIVRVPLVNGAHDLDAMAQAAREGATLVWLPNPHNPTGVTFGLEDLVAFLDDVPGDCLVVLDEAYGAFAQRHDSHATLALGDGRANVLIQRTFSKDWGLAGLRLGYAIGDAALIDALRRARPPFSVNALALAAVSAALECNDWRDAMVARIIAERELLESTLEELGVDFFSSEANFVTCALTFPGFRDALSPQGLSVRDGADLGLPGWTRITVGWAPQMATLRDVLRRYVATIARENR
jgi:histidinol-phosphate aminotransferase